MYHHTLYNGNTCRTDFLDKLIAIHYHLRMNLSLGRAPIYFNSLPTSHPISVMAFLDLSCYLFVVCLAMLSIGRIIRIQILNTD